MYKRQLHSFGCRVSLFVDAGVDGLESAKAIGADRIEIYTGPFAEAQSMGCLLYTSRCV